MFTSTSSPFLHLKLLCFFKVIGAYILVSHPTHKCEGLPSSWVQDRASGNTDGVPLVRKRVKRLRIFTAALERCSNIMFTRKGDSSMFVKHFSNTSNLSTSTVTKCEYRSCRATLIELCLREVTHSHQELLT